MAKGVSGLVLRWSYIKDSFEPNFMAMSTCGDVSNDRCSIYELARGFLNKSFKMVCLGPRGQKIGMFRADSVEN